MVDILTEMKYTNQQIASTMKSLNDSHIILCDNFSSYRAEWSSFRGVMMRLLVITVVALAILAGAEKIITLL